MRWVSARLVLAGLALGCGAASAPGPTPRPAPGVAAAADRIAELASAALSADAQLQSADSLYAPGAEIVVNGEHVSSPPRYAGLGTGGQVVVSASRVDLAGRFAWALLEYRWLAPDRNLLREGRATFVFAQQADRRWLIVHAHSSSPR
jgi:SnoaL-like domain